MSLAGSASWGVPAVAAALGGFASSRLGGGMASAEDYEWVLRRASLRDDYVALQLGFAVLCPAADHSIAVLVVSICKMARRAHLGAASGRLPLGRGALRQRGRPTDDPARRGWFALRRLEEGGG